MTRDPKTGTIDLFPKWDWTFQFREHGVKVMGRGLLAEFCNKHPDCRKWIANWIADASASRWMTSHDIKARYPSASFLATNVVIFNVRGNEYRMETQVAYNVGVITIKWVGTHDQYTKRMH